MQILNSGALGTIKRVHASMCVPILNGNDIRYNFALGGGSMMDTGCYAVNCIRLLAGDNFQLVGEDQEVEDSELHIEVTSAKATTCYPQIDKHMKAELKFTRSKGGQRATEEGEKEGQTEEEGKGKDKEETADRQESSVQATMECSIFQLIPSLNAYAVGDKGEVRVINFVAPFFYHKITTKLYEPRVAETSAGGWKWWMTAREPKYTVKEESVCPVFDTKVRILSGEASQYSNHSQYYRDLHTSISCSPL